VSSGEAPAPATGRGRKRDGLGEPALKLFEHDEDLMVSAAVACEQAAWFRRLELLD
jgi:hypothetical protein